MTRRPAFLRRFAAAREGVTIVEFALALGPFLVLILGLVDLGFRLYAGIMLQGALEEAARQVTVGNVTQATITTFVQKRISGVVPNGTVAIAPSSYYDYTGIGTMEPITTDQNGNGQLDSGDCYTDYNSDNIRDTNNGTTGLGGSDDIVYYTATLTFPSFVPYKLFIGQDQSTETVKAVTMMKNQPYAAQPTPPTVCIS